MKQIFIFAFLFLIILTSGALSLPVFNYTFGSNIDGLRTDFKLYGDSNGVIAWTADNGGALRTTTTGGDKRKSWGNNTYFMKVGDKLSVASINIYDDSPSGAIGESWSLCNTTSTGSVDLMGMPYCLAGHEIDGAGCNGISKFIYCLDSIQGNHYKAAITRVNLTHYNLWSRDLNNSDVYNKTFEIHGPKWVGFAGYGYTGAWSLDTLYYAMNNNSVIVPPPANLNIFDVLPLNNSLQHNPLIFSWKTNHSANCSLYVDFSLSYNTLTANNSNFSASLINGTHYFYVNCSDLNNKNASYGLLNFYVPAPVIPIITTAQDAFNDILINIFLTALWLFFLVMTLKEAGSHGETIQLFNIAQLILCLTASFRWLDVPVLTISLFGVGLAVFMAKILGK